MTMKKRKSLQKNLKELNEQEFTDLQWKFVESTTFKAWEEQEHLVGAYMHNGKKILNRMVVQLFLKQKGYILEKNVDLRVAKEIKK